MINFDTQLKYLKTPEQLDKVPEEYVDRFDKKQVKILPHNFDEKKVKKIKNECVEAVPLSLVPLLSVEQVVNILPEQTLEATKEHLQHFSEKQFKSLPENFPPEKLLWIADNKVQWLPLYLVPHFSNEQVMHATKEQGNKFSVQQIAQLSDRQSAKGIDSIPDDKLRYLNRENAKTIASISFSRVQHLTWQQLKKRGIFWNALYILGVVTLGIVLS